MVSVDTPDEVFAVSSLIWDEGAGALWIEAVESPGLFEVGSVRRRGEAVDGLRYGTDEY